MLSRGSEDMTVIKLSENARTNFRDKIPIGTQFEYLGLTLCVTAHIDPKEADEYPVIMTDYVDASGNIRQHFMSYELADTLLSGDKSAAPIKENHRAI